MEQWWQELDHTGGTKMYNFQQKLKALKAKIHTWNREDFRNIFEDKKILIRYIDLIQQEGMESWWDTELKEKEKYLLSQPDARERQEEFIWKQKSWVKWLH